MFIQDTLKVESNPGLLSALVLDDSSFDRDRIRRLSKKMDIPVAIFEVESIRDLRNAISERRFDLIILDYYLPKGTGLDALASINECSLNQSAAKLMMSGTKFSTPAVQAVCQGCHSFLNKDEVSVESLRNAMLSAIYTSYNTQRTIESLNQKISVLEDRFFETLNSREFCNFIVGIIRSELPYSVQKENVESKTYIRDLLDGLEEQVINEPPMNLDL